MYLAKSGVGCLEIQLQQVAKQGQRPRSWRLIPYFLGGETTGDKTENEHDSNSPQQSGRTGEEEEHKILQRRHFLFC